MSYKKGVLLKISQNSQKNNCDRCFKNIVIMMIIVLTIQAILVEVTALSNYSYNKLTNPSISPLIVEAVGQRCSVK